MSFALLSDRSRGNNSGVDGFIDYSWEVSSLVLETGRGPIYYNQLAHYRKSILNSSIYSPCYPTYRTVPLIPQITYLSYLVPMLLFMASPAGS